MILKTPILKWNEGLTVELLVLSSWKLSNVIITKKINIGHVSFIFKKFNFFPKSMKE